MSTCRRLHVIAGLAFLLVTAPAAAASCGPEKLGVSREIAIDGSQGLSLGLQSYPATLALADHEVVLTFDDGPAATTAQVLAALQEECVRATFFVIGENATGMPATVKREVSDGHSVGYHSNTHPAKTLRLMYPEGAKADIDAGVAAVDKAAYGAASDKPHNPFFRFPGFADTPALLDYVHGRGMAVFGADLWASDWQAMTPQSELALVMGRLEKLGKGIVLFHDSRISTAKMMPDFLRALKEKGFKIVHMVAGAGPTPVEKAGPDWKSTTEPIIARTLSGHGHVHGGETKEAEPAAR
ncbi:polysaccharide deacetylase family protein [Methylocystis heyeri]|uniref:Chitooligosaccharide deacetylase n=1 Tax=Methylocystis heyeri TaxID=391905 RepID=A0A6B8K935_9HYPH|nr:polysaccharide deacetylase family protein [Methylocystis heyeri]QGM44586.1 polysaccharide deacetylase family protein [Methylocystis heyeri]